jgi:hypothetical protein
MPATMTPRNCLDLKRKIAELERLRSNMKLDLRRIQIQPGCATQEELADIENSLILLEDELGELVQRYEQGCPS